jgi:DNA-binding IclR family transcriptional regulator
VWRGIGAEGIVSIEVMSAVWKHADVSGATLLVLLALADYANENGICWPGVAALSRKARVSERYVRDLLGDLERSGLIVRDVGTGPYGVNTYKILVGDAILAGVRTDTPGGLNC